MRWCNNAYVRLLFFNLELLMIYGVHKFLVILAMVFLLYSCLQKWLANPPKVLKMFVIK